MLISYVVLTYNRKDELKVCLDSIVAQTYHNIQTVVVDNNSQDGTDKLIKYYPQVKYVRLDYNSGVCQGRNIGFDNANGDIIIVIDDDGELPHPNVTTQIVQAFNARPEMGIMALRVVNPKDPVTRRIIPSTDKKIAEHKTETEVAYFLGGGVAIRKQVLEEAGNYPSEYFYSMEELDLSYRLAKTDWKIYYYPQIHVLHHESVGQRPGWRRYYYDFRNRIWLTTSFLPLRYLIINLSFWGLRLALQSLRHGHFKSFVKGVKEGWRQLPRYRQRRRQHLLRANEVKRIRTLGGRLWY